MKPLGQFEVWFVTGSQEMYGDATLRQVAANARRIADALDALGRRSRCGSSTGPVVTSPESIAAACREANATDACVGVIALDAHLLAGPDVDRRASRRSTSRSSTSTPSSTAISPGARSTWTS